MKRFSMLMLVFAIVFISGSFAQAEDHAYVGAAKCKMCHKVQYASWAESSHAKALDHAKAATDKTYGDDCLQCHATNSKAELPGVQCEACHGAGADYKKMSIMKDHEKAIANGLIDVTQATCDACHTGEDHAAKKVLADEKDNNAAIHEHKKK